MRHSFYANNRNTKTVRNTGRPHNQSRSGNHYKPGLRDQITGTLNVNKTEKLLEVKVKTALKANEDDPKTRSEILGELSMYQANITIAREYHDKKSEKDLTKNFINYLNQKSNESRGK